MSDATEATPVVFPVAFPRFAKAIKGTRDEVWTHLMSQRHGTEKHTLAEWRALLATLKTAA